MDEQDVLVGSLPSFRELQSHLLEIDSGAAPRNFVLVSGNPWQSPTFWTVLLLPEHGCVGRGIAILREV